MNKLSIQIKAVFSDFVAAVEGIDLSCKIEQETVYQLRSLLKTYSVLVFRNQKITLDQLVSFAKIFGNTNICSDITNLNENNEIVDHTSFEARQKKGNFLWHVDMPILEAPPLAAFLHAVEIPSSGGNTQFIDTSKALNNLPTEWAQRLKGRYVIHDLETIRRRMGIINPDELKNNYQPRRHPLVCIDPFSGKSCLMISAHTKKIEGLDDANQDSIIEELINLITDKPYTHIWQPYDLIFWNNRRSLHRALPYNSEGERRRLKRVEIVGGDKPEDATSLWCKLKYMRKSWFSSKTP